MELLLTLILAIHYHQVADKHKAPKIRWSLIGATAYAIPVIISYVLFISFLIATDFTMIDDMSEEGFLVFYYIFMFVNLVIGVICANYAVKYLIKEKRRKEELELLDADMDLLEDEL